MKKLKFTPENLIQLKYSINCFKVFKDVKIFKTKLYNNLLDCISDGKFFSVNITKDDGTKRTITARYGVKKHLTGKGLKYDPSRVFNVIVYDIHKKGYRTIKLSRINYMNTKGQKINFQ